MGWTSHPLVCKELWRKINIKYPTKKCECIVHSILVRKWENKKLNQMALTLHPSKVMREGKKPSTYKKKRREWEKEGVKITWLMGSNPNFISK